METPRYRLLVTLGVVAAHVMATSVTCRWQQYLVFQFLSPILLASQASLLAIWLQTGKGSFMVRCSAVIVAYVILFLLFSSPFLPSSRDYWNDFTWIGYFGVSDGAMFAHTAPVWIPMLLICVALIRRYNRSQHSDPSSTFTVGAVLLLVSAVAAALGLLVTIPPYRKWIVDFILQSLSMFNSGPYLILRVVEQPIVYVTLALAAYWCSQSEIFRPRVFVFALIVIPAFTTVVQEASAALVIIPQEYFWSLKRAMFTAASGALIIVTIFATLMIVRAPQRIPQGHANAG